MKNQRITKTDTTHRRKHTRLYVQAGGRCEICGRKVVRTKILRKYRTKVHESSDSVSWMTPYGERMFAPKSTVGHIISRWQVGTSNHDNNLRIECGDCNNKASALEHEQFRTRVKTKPHVCLRCGGYKASTTQKHCPDCRFPKIFDQLPGPCFLLAERWWLPAGAWWS